MNKVPTDVKCEAEDFGLLLASLPWFGVFGPTFPKLPYGPKYHKAGITQTL